MIYQEDPTNEMQPAYNAEFSRRVLHLVDLETRTPGLGSFLQELYATNEVRGLIESGDLDDIPSREAYLRIWKVNSGSTPQEMALAYAEGVTDPKSYSYVEFLSDIQGNDSLADRMGLVREIENMPPMLFQLPDPPKSRIAEILFDYTDRIISAADGPAYEKGAVLQAHLRFIHLMRDGNGRSCEDWSPWLQRQLVNHAAKKAASMPSRKFVPDYPPLVKPDTVRSWYTSGLRSRYAEKFDAPPFLVDAFTQEYKEARDLMETLTIYENQLRRGMYAELAKHLEYEGAPADFPSYIAEHQQDVVTFFENIYSGNTLTHSTCFVGEFNGYELQYLLSQQPVYEYKAYQERDIIKPEYIEQQGSE